MSNFKDILDSSDGKKIRLLIILIILAAAAFVFFARTGDDGISLEDGSEVTNEDVPLKPDTPNNSDNGNSESDSETSSDVVICDVSGAVKQPKVVELKKGSRISDAIEQAGGLTDKADISNINRAAVVNDGDKILIPEKGSDQAGQMPAQSGNGSAGASGSQGAGSGQSGSAGSASGSAGGSAGAGSGQTGQGSAAGKISLNNADSATLQQISGVGPVTAEKIIDYRNQNGGFKNIEQLKEINGIGDKTFEKMKDQVSL